MTRALGFRRGDDEVKKKAPRVPHCRGCARERGQQHALSGVRKREVSQMRRRGCVRERGQRDARARGDATEGQP